MFVNLSPKFVLYSKIVLVNLAALSLEVAQWYFNKTIVDPKLLVILQSVVTMLIRTLSNGHAPLFITTNPEEPNHHA